MAVQSANLDSLPSELLIQILIPFTTRQLLPLTTVSCRFHDLVLRILHFRLLAAASLDQHNLILECYHPSAKLTTPGLVCEYLGTPGLSPDHSEHKTPVVRSNDLYATIPRSQRLAKLGGLYSHFRPSEPETERQPRRPHPAGSPNQSLNQAAELILAAHGGPGEAEKKDIPSQIISLESHELFSQLVTVANLVKVGPKRGLFLSCVTIGEGVIRIWRDWLADLAVTPFSKSKSRSYDDIEGPLEAADGSTTNSFVETDPSDDDKRTLWLDSKRTVGVRLRVIESEDLAAPILRSRDEDAGVSYTIEYEELFIKTSQLLLNVEESLQQENSHSGKAIVIGTW